MLWEKQTLPPTAEVLHFFKRGCQWRHMGYVEIFCTVIVLQNQPSTYKWSCNVAVQQKEEE